LGFSSHLLQADFVGRSEVDRTRRMVFGETWSMVNSKDRVRAIVDHRPFRPDETAELIDRGQNDLSLGLWTPERSGTNTGA